MARRKAVTLKDIATQANVSPAVVSTVLNNRNNGVWVSETTRQNILELAQRLGYRAEIGQTRPAQRQQRGINVAILCLPWYSPLFGQTVAELCQTLGRWGFHPFIQVNGDKAASCAAGLELHRQGRADAFIMLGTRSRPEELAIGDIPCVVIGEVAPDYPVWSVCIDNFHGGQLVGEHLWRLGHRRVGVISLANALYCDKEVAGLCSVWEARQTPFPADRILTLSDLAGLPEALPRFLAQPAFAGAPLTALFCAGDAIAAPTARILKQSGWRIPEDISLVGFDDAPLLADCMDPPLTTVRQPFVQLGHLAAQLLRERIEHPNTPPRRMFLPGELVLRRSCAPVTELTEELPRKGGEARSS